MRDAKFLSLKVALLGKVDLQTHDLMSSKRCLKDISITIFFYKISWLFSRKVNKNILKHLVVS